MLPRLVYVVERRAAFQASTLLDDGVMRDGILQVFSVLILHLPCLHVTCFWKLEQFSFWIREGEDRGPVFPGPSHLRGIL